MGPNEAAQAKMKNQISNAIYGVLDYLAYPLGMLAIAPVALRSLGNDRYGIWTIALSAVSTGAIIASGFGDANIRVVAMRRAAGNQQNVIRAVRSTMGIHVLLGFAMAIAAWLLTPMATTRLVRETSGLRADCLWSLRVACLLIPVRAIESVCISTQRAYERYGSALRISAVTRLLSLACAGVLPFITHTVVSILAATALISAYGVWLQIKQLRILLNASSLLPVLDRETAWALLSFGVFAWIQTVSGLVFGQLDLDWKEFVEADPRYFRPAEVDHLEGDAAKARRLLGWEPATDVRALAAMMVDADLQLARREALLRDAGHAEALRSGF